MKYTSITNKVRTEIRSMSPIQWGESKYDNSSIILKWGENPYTPSQIIIDTIVRSLKSINRYPSLMSTLKIKLSKYTGIDQNQILLTNGADKAFRLIAEIFINKKDEAITFTPSYPVFDESINMMGGKVIKIPLTAYFKIPFLSSLKKYITDETKIVYICNPNNPTGNFIASNEDIERILKLELIVVVDEAYFEFSGISAAGLLEKYENLIILRSYSKTFGLAGLRVAYMLLSSRMVDYFKKVEDSIEVFNISTPSLAGAIAALDDYRSIMKNISRINNSKKTLTRKLNKLNIFVYPSSTSFIMFNLKKTGIKTSNFIEGMSKEKIILKDVSIYSGLSEYDVYMAIPREDQITRVVNSISKIIKSLS